MSEQTTVIEAAVHRQSFTWSIVNFSKVCEQFLFEEAASGRKDPPLKSDIIQLEGSKSTWRLYCFPQMRKNDTSYVVLRLKCESEDPDVYEVTHTISVIGSAGEIGPIRNEGFYSECQKILAAKGKYLPNDILRVSCQFRVVEKYRAVKDVSHLDSQKIPKFSLDLPALFENQKFCDFMIHCDGSEFRVHKLILSERSPVFASMLQHDMLETRLNEVHISDVNAATMERLLHYVYGKAIENLLLVESMDLYEAADKYQLLELKHHCSSVIVKNLDTDVVCEVARLADMHNDSSMFTSAQNFVTNNVVLGPFVSTKAWIDFVMTSPDAANRLISKIF